MQRPDSLVRDRRGEAADGVVPEHDGELVGALRGGELPLEPAPLRVVDVALGGGPSTPPSETVSSEMKRKPGFGLHA